MDEVEASLSGSNGLNPVGVAAKDLRDCLLTTLPIR
ncbi:hypothetical protein [Escherichia coli]